MGTARMIAAMAAAKFLKSIEPWYDWGTQEVSRLDATSRDFTDESYGEVRFFELQWLGVHFAVQLGRTPPRRSAEKIARERHRVDEKKREREVDRTCTALTKHLKLMRSRDWRAAVNTLNAENSSAELTDDAIGRAGAAFSRVMACRVSTVDELREKLLIMCSNAGFTEAFLDELFRDLDDDLFRNLVAIERGARPEVVA